MCWQIRAVNVTAASSFLTVGLMCGDLPCQFILTLQDVSPN
jgi:hypothetical protein